MTESFFLVHLIDKDNYNGINVLHRFSHDLFTMGRSHYVGDIIYIMGIEPEPEKTFNLLSGGFGMDSSSIWIGVDIVPKDTFEENVALFKNLSNWIMDFLYLLRFLINLNLKARVFFHVENYKEGRNSSKLSFQKTIETYCDTGSNFRIEYNQYHLVLPLLEKLLQSKPTDKLRAIMYNHASGKAGDSMIIDYFYSFATFEGIFHNWAEVNGYSELWGTAIAKPNEQKTIHENLRALFEKFVKEHNFEDNKLYQLNSFKDSTFPTKRKIMRTLNQRFKSYCSNRLTTELQENEYILAMLSNFRSIYSRRNEIGHSLKTYAQSSGFSEDANTLMSAIKIIMDFELEKFLNGEIDWKFEDRLENLRNEMRPITQAKMLDNFTYNLLAQNQRNIQLKDRVGTRLIENVEFRSGMIYQDDIDINTTNLIFSQNLRLILPPDFITRLESPSESKIIDIYENPYWWISTTKEGSHYIFKTFPPDIITTTSKTDAKETFCKISSENILLVIRLDLIEIPEDLEIFS